MWEYGACGSSDTCPCCEDDAGVEWDDTKRDRARTLLKAKSQPLQDVHICKTDLHT